MTGINPREIDVNFGWGDDEEANREEVASLFPPEGKEKATLAIGRIRKVLERERSMREYVFRADEKKRSQKVREMDDCIKDLREIEEVIKELDGRI